MTTKNFTEFIADVVARATRNDVPMGTAFVDELYCSDRALLADGLAVTNYDPMGKRDVSMAAITFVSRNW